MNLFARDVLKQKLQSKLQLFVISIYIFLNLMTPNPKEKYFIY